MNNTLVIKNNLVASYPNRGITFVKGEAAYLITQSGEKYLDLGSNYGVNIFGYRHPTITNALHKQLDNLVNLHGSFGSDVRNRAAEKLINKCGGKLSRIFFSNSGAEAIEAALKFARAATGKTHFIAMKNAYHGKTLGALSATSGDKYKKMFAPLLWNFEFVEHGNIEPLEKAIDTDVAAFIVEPIQGEGGIYTPPADYLQKVRKICDKHNILLILDEIQTGCGRTGTFLASQKYGINYDIVCMGKGLAGGLPVGATLVSKEIAAKIPKQIHTSTFGGNPLAAAGIIATLELLNEEIMTHVKKTGAYFIGQLKTIDSPLISDVRGQGLMIGLEMKDKRNEILKELQLKNILAIPAGENVVRFLPPFIIEKKQINEAIKVLKEVII